MRSNLLGMCSAVAAVAVAGSANATIVVDNFTVGSFSRQNVPGTNGSGGSSGWTATTDASIFALPGSNNSRSVQAGTSNTIIIPDTVTSSSSFSSSANGTASVNLAANWGTFGAATAWADLVYGKPHNDTLGLPASSVDITSFSTLTMFGSGTAAISGTNQGSNAIVAYVNIRDNAGNQSNSTIAISAGAVGNISLDLGTVTGIIKSQVRSIQFQFYMTGVNFTNLNAGSASLSYDISGVQLVPAPGAVALLGAAGLVGTRRRRN
jgi:hypothetical protein